jgi:dihydrofolate reductase
MRRIIVNEFLSLDGVAQAPGGADEDRDGRFQHGGWHLPHLDEVGGRWVDDGLSEAGGFLLGRRTYELFAAYWPNASAEERTAADPLNTLPKYVVSATLAEPLEWQNSTLLKGDIPEAVAALKQGGGKDLYVFGSTKLVNTLVGRDLVDEFRVMIDPLILGGGKSIFPSDGKRRNLRLLKSEVTGTGAILATYRSEALHGPGS